MRKSPALHAAEAVAFDAGVAAGASDLKPEHLLFGICFLDRPGPIPPEERSIRLEHDLVQQSLLEMGLDRGDLEQFGTSLGPGQVRHGAFVVKQSREYLEALDQAGFLAKGAPANCLHVLSSILGDPPDAVRELCAALPHDLHALCKIVSSRFDEASKPPARRTRARRAEPDSPIGDDDDLDDDDDDDDDGRAQDGEADGTGSRGGADQGEQGRDDDDEGDEDEDDDDGPAALADFGRDLTAEARNGDLAPLIGRERELLEMIRILAQEKKNNPVLVGEPGVGKTAIVEGLALKLVQTGEPEFLRDARIVEIRVNSLLAGTMYRGEFEKKLEAVIEAVTTEPNTILFIDELHMLIGSGTTVGSNKDGADALKPHLARGKFRLIGATTTSEYRSHIEIDPAFERRLVKVLVAEPTRDESIAMLQALRPRWEEHHGVVIEDGALEAAVDLSTRFDADHRLPDKALALVDGAAVAARFPDQSGLERKGALVGRREIAEVLGARLGLPLDLVLGSAGPELRERLLFLEEHLSRKVTGQSAAIAQVAKRLQTAYAGIGKRNGPVAVMLFLGPTGVGKTELAKALAEHLFGRADDMIRLDMSEFYDSHTVSKLIGSPPGYAGHNEEGQLTGKLRTRPHSILLLDEIEKAHPRVLDQFLPLFDEGRITDSKGRTIDATNIIVIMTSNLGAQAAVIRTQIGFGDAPAGEATRPADPLDALLTYFRPELLNRIDERVVFEPLTREAIFAILEPMVAETVAAVASRYGAELVVAESALELLATEGYNPNFGARWLRRTLEVRLQGPVAERALRGDLAAGSRWIVSAGEGTLQLSPAESPTDD